MSDVESGDVVALTRPLSPGVEPPVVAEIPDLEARVREAGRDLRRRVPLEHRAHAAGLLEVFGVPAEELRDLDPVFHRTDPVQVLPREPGPHRGIELAVEPDGFVGLAPQRGTAQR